MIFKKSENQSLSKNFKNNIKCSTEVPVSPQRQMVPLEDKEYHFLFIFDSYHFLLYIL